MIRPDWFRRRRRLWTIVVFLGIVGAIFILFQLFTLNMLGRQSQREAKQNIAEHDLGMHDFHPKNIHKIDVMQDIQNLQIGDKNNFKMGQDNLQDKSKVLPHEENMSEKNCSIRGDCDKDVYDKLNKHTEIDSIKYPRKVEKNLKFDVENLHVEKTHVTIKDIKIVPEIHGNWKVMDDGERPAFRDLMAAQAVTLLGVHPSYREHYTGDGEGMFTCLDSKVRLYCLESVLTH